MDEREAYIALNAMDRVGPVGVRAMVSVLGSARAIFEADAAALRQARGVGPELAAAVVGQREGVDWEGELQRAAASGARIVTCIDPEYPERLAEIHDPPLALYVRGSLQSRDRHGVAVVGTRRPTHYGRDVAGKLAGQLAKGGCTVISGLAQGIDTVAHEAALGAKGRTIAVLGSALDCLYPASNRELADRIAEQGAVISELPFGRKPDKTTFPMRNRIVSGMSLGVLVVEAGQRSGALITAGQAADQGRSVFAVPGRIDSAASRGCHALLRTGARLVEDVDDILRDFDYLLPPGAGASGGPDGDAPRPELSEDEERLVSLVTAGTQDVDALIRESGLSAAQVSSLLIGLEMKRMVRTLPGHVVEPARA